MPFCREIKISQNCAFVNDVLYHIGLVLWALGNCITTSDQSPLIASRQERSQDFTQEEANLTRAQGAPCQKLNTRWISPTIF